MASYGTEKPDILFGMEIVNLSLVFADKILSGKVQAPVWGFLAPGLARYSRKQLDELKECVPKLGAQTLYYANVTTEGIESPLETMRERSDLEPLPTRTDG